MYIVLWIYKLLFNLTPKKISSSATGRDRVLLGKSMNFFFFFFLRNRTKPINIIECLKNLWKQKQNHPMEYLSSILTTEMKVLLSELKHVRLHCLA